MESAVVKRNQPRSRKRRMSPSTKRHAKPTMLPSRQKRQPTKLAHSSVEKEKRGRTERRHELVRVIAPYIVQRRDSFCMCSHGPRIYKRSTTRSHAKILCSGRRSATKLPTDHESTGYNRKARVTAMYVADRTTMRMQSNVPNKQDEGRGQSK